MNKVLIIDDSKSARFFLKSCLPKEDIELREASDGEAGLAVAQEFAPDVVFLDLTMPVMDGYTALPLIRQAVPSCKVIVLTADIQQKSIERIEAAGAFMHLKKPPKKDMVQAALAAALGQD